MNNLCFDKHVAGHTLLLFLITLSPAIPSTVICLINVSSATLGTVVFDTCSSAMSLRVLWISASSAILSTISFDKLVADHTPHTWFGKHVVGHTLCSISQYKS